MPYVIRKNESQWCVYKEGADGEPTGESLGCHDSESGAQEQMRALYANDDHADMPMHGKATTAIKALNDTGRVGGYLVVWGDANTKDLQGEYFTPDTNLYLDWYKARPALYHHGLDGHLKATVIGQIDVLKEDDIGVWAEAQLDMRQKYVQAVNNLIDKGVLGWSSGSLPHLVKTAPDGRIEEWPIVEGSMTPAPAEPRRTNINTIKTAYEQLGLDLAPLNIPVSDPAKEPRAKEQSDASGLSNESQEESDMDVNEFAQQVLDAVLAKLADGQTLTAPEQQQVVEDAVAATQETEVTADNAEAVAEAVAPAVMKAVDATLKAREATRTAAKNAATGAVNGLFNEIQPQSRAGGASVPQNGGNGPRIEVTRANKYSHLSAEDLGFAYDFMRRGSRANPNGVQWVPTEEFMRTFADKSIKSINTEKFTVGNDAIKALEFFGDQGNYFKAGDELDYSTLSGYGDQWVPDTWLSSLWNKARLDNMVASEVNMIDMPTDPFELPTEGSDPTVYHPPETSDETQLTIASSASAIPDSQIGTGKVQLDAEKLAVRMGWSMELQEDSVIAVAPQFRNQTLRALMDAVDNVLLNGDTDLTASTNINYIDDTPTTQKWTAADGMIKQAIITTTANAVDGGGDAISLDEMRTARATLANQYKTPASMLRWYVDPSTYITVLNMPEILTASEYGLDATVIKGDVRVIDGIPIYPSAEIHLANTAGKVVAADTGTLGRAVLVRPSMWYLGYRRRPTVFVEYLSYYDAYQMTATLRLDCKAFDNDNVSVIYNLLV